MVSIVAYISCLVIKDLLVAPLIVDFCEDFHIHRIGTWSVFVLLLHLQR